MIHHGIHVVHLLAIADADCIEAQLRSLTREPHAHGGARGLRTEADGMQAAGRTARERRGQRVDPDRTRGELLDPVVLKTCALGETRVSGRGHETSLGPRAHVPFNDLQCAVSADGQVQAGVRTTLIRR